MDSAGSPILLNCLMYKMCYYRFGEMQVNCLNLLVLNMYSLAICWLTLHSFLLIIFITAKKGNFYQNVANAWQNAFDNRQHCKGAMATPFLRLTIFFSLDLLLKETLFTIYLTHFLFLHYFQLDFRSPSGFDRTRNVEIGNKNFNLEHLEEAFTSEHWLVRIYK